MASIALWFIVRKDEVAEPAMEGCEGPFKNAAEADAHFRGMMSGYYMKHRDNYVIVKAEIPAKLTVFPVEK